MANLATLVLGLIVARAAAFRFYVGDVPDARRLTLAAAACVALLAIGWYAAPSPRPPLLGLGLRVLAVAALIFGAVIARHLTIESAEPRETAVLVMAIALFAVPVLVGFTTRWGRKRMR